MDARLESEKFRLAGVTRPSEVLEGGVEEENHEGRHWKMYTADVTIDSIFLQYLDGCHK